MAPTYKVEELLAVRGSVSESAVSLEKFADEDAIKEHVLRPSASASRIGHTSKFTAQSIAPHSLVRSNLLLATPKLPTTALESAKRPSPSPSVKRAKAEKLLKEHGSPPGRRVTAGGRIVPTDWTWSGNYVPPYPRFAPFFPYQHTYGSFGCAQQSTDLPNGFVGYNLNGRLCQIVDGEMRELLDGTLFMAAPNIPFPAMDSMTRNSAVEGMARSFSQPQPSVRPSLESGYDTFLGLDRMPFEKQIQYLDGEMKKAKYDHNQIERKEVMQEQYLSAVDREVMVSMKRDLVNKMDQIRKFKKGLEEIASGLNIPSGGTHQQEQSAFPPTVARTSTYAQPAPLTNTFMNDIYPSLSSPTLSDDAKKPAAPMNAWQSMSVPEPSKVMASRATNVAPPVPAVSRPLKINGIDIFAFKPIEITTTFPVTSRRSKRSHAIEIKAPPEEATKSAARSTLDPTSPTYQPAHIFVPPSPSPIDSPAVHPVTQNTWLGNTDASDSSVSTTNFFPNEAAEHSQRKHVFAKPTTDLPGAERSAFSGEVHETTPQKDWVRNAQSVSQVTSPELNHPVKASMASPIETRMSSWTQDILPSLEPANSRHSPELVRMNGPTGLHALTNTPARTSNHETPNKPNGVFNGKPDEWCQGYMFGSTSRVGAQPDHDTSIEFKAGFYQGLADREKKKSLSAQTTPDRENSRQSSGQQIPPKSTSNSNLFAVGGMNDTAINPLSMTENVRGGSRTRYTNGGSFYPFVKTDNIPLTSVHVPQMSSAVNLSGISVEPGRHTLAGVNQLVSHSPSKRDKSYRGYSDGAVGDVQVQTMTSVDNEAAPYLWKEHHLREQQVSSMLKPLGLSARSGNQLATSNRVTSGTYNAQRYYPELKTMITRREPKAMDPIGTRRRTENVSQFDGASDDVAELSADGFTPANKAQAQSPPHVRETPSPSKNATTPAGETQDSSPKKSNSSPSKAKEVRDRVTSKVGRMIKGNEQPKSRLDPAEMDPAQKERRRSQWRKRFQQMKKEDHDALEKNRAERNKP